MSKEVLKDFEKYISEVKEKVDKCDNNSPYLVATLMYTIRRHVEDKALTAKEGSDIQELLYDTTRGFRKCICKK